MKTNLKMSFTGGVKNRFFGVVALFTVVAFGVLFTACGGGGGGGGGSASTGSGTTWGGKTTITIPFTNGRAGVSQGFAALNWDSIDLTVTQTANGTSEVIFDESITEPENVTIEVITGSKIDATAVINMKGDEEPRTATGSIDRVATGKNTLTLYVEYRYKLVDGGGAVLNDGECEGWYTSREGLELPSSYVTADNIKIVTEFIDNAPGGKSYRPSRHHDITGDIELKAEISPLNVHVSDGKWYIGCDQGNLGSTLTIPAKVGDYKISGIGNGYFQDHAEIQTVIIEEGIEEIGPEAFKGCTNLTSVTIPSTLTQLGKSAFENCTSLSGTVTIPGGVSVIGKSAFQECSNLQGVVMKEGVNTIGENAFSKCKNLSRVEFPATTLRVIDAFGFNECKNLPATVTLPEGLQSIGKLAFWYCDSIENLIIPSTIEQVEFTFFYNSRSAKTIKFYTKIPPTVWGHDPDSYSNRYEAMKRCTILLPIGASKEAWVNAFAQYTTINPEKIEFF